MTYETLLQIWNAIQSDAGIAACALAFLGILVFGNKRKRSSKDRLDEPLYWWDKENPLSLRAMLSGGIHVFGQTGSGKTSATKSLAQKILNYGNSSVLFLCAKKDDYFHYLELAHKAGREAEVIFIDHKSKYRFNMPGYEASRKGEGAGQAANVVRFLMEIRSTIFRESDQGGGDSLQWKKQDERLLGHAVTALMIAGEEVMPANIHNFIASSPRDRQQLMDSVWRSMYCNVVLAKAAGRASTEIETHDVKLALDYWLNEWPEMADRTRSSIKVGTMQILTVMNTGICREMFASKTNTTPEEQIEGRKIVIVNYPPPEWGDLGYVANVGLKYIWQKAILRRQVTGRASAHFGGFW